MNGESSFTAIFAILCVVLIFLRYYFTMKATRSSGPKLSLRGRWEKSLEYEGKITIILQTMLFPIWVTALILYILYPAWMTWAALPFPAWLRWMGVSLGIISLLLFIWAQHILGKYYSPQLEIKESHSLVTNGPYRWIRHPMYSAYFLFLIAIAIVPANLLIAVINSIWLARLYARIGREEQMMMDQFGDEYRTYMQNTGRLYPRFTRKRPNQHKETVS